MDPRVEKLARTLIRFSTRVQKGDNVLIQARNETDALVRALIRETCGPKAEYGGGETYFDDALIRRDGRFVLPELECLNPENLR